MKPIMILLAALCLSVSLQAQQLEISQPRKAVRTSGDVGAVLLPVAGLTAILIEKRLARTETGRIGWNYHIRSYIRIEICG